MKKSIAIFFVLVLLASMVATQTPQKPREEIAPEDVIRVTTNLVQIDAVVTDKNDKVVPDLKLEDFEVYDKGKKQEIKFMEFNGVDTARRTEGEPPAALSKYLEQTGAGVSSKDLKRVIAFVIDDLTMEIPDLPAVRKMLLGFVNTKMRDDDLVAIVRVVGGKGLLQQFTSDRQLLRRAIAQITVTINPLSTSQAPDPERLRAFPVASLESSAVDEPSERPEIFSANDDTVRYFRGLSALSTANFVISSLRTIRGRKDLVILTGGISIFEPQTAGSPDITPMLDRLRDNATRAGVAISTMDPRGLRATPGVKSFEATPARSAMAADNPNFGKGDPGASSALSPPLAGALEHLGLSSVAKATGGVPIFNTNNFEAGLDKILAHSNGYYTLAYAPKESFDRSFHNLEIKVKREGTRVYHHEGYRAVDEAAARSPRTKEESIAAAARSPLARNEIDVTPNIGVKLNPGKNANVDIHVLIDAAKLSFTEEGDRYRDSLDIVGFIFDQAGRIRGGFSETINLNLSKTQYQKALVEGLTYSAGTEVQPDYYQVRVVVREQTSGYVGSFSKYLEIPDLSKGKMALSSLFLLATDAKGNNPIPLFASRRLNRQQDLRYVAVVYNAKIKDGKPQLRSQLIISQGNKVLFQEPEQPVESSGSGPVTKIGQLALSGVAPGRYVLTLIITDTLADKKTSTQSRSLDFTVVSGPLATAEEPKPASKTSPEPDIDTLKIDTNLVTVPVIASSRTGSYIADLKKEEFKLTEDGVGQEIAFLASVDAPFYVVLMLDTSNSTKEKLPLIQRAAIAFLEQIRPNDKVKIISFDGVLRSWDDFTSDKTILRGAISKTRVGDSTSVYDAMQLALDSLRPIQQRKAIVLFSDGVDSHSKQSSFESTVRNLDESGVIVYPIRFDTRVETERLVLQQDAAASLGRLSRVPNPDKIGSPRPQNATISAQLDNAYLLADSYLRKLADRSGGQLYRADTVASLPQAFAAIAGELRTQYLLGYYPTDKSDNAAYRKIQVKTSRKDIAIRARPGYRPKNQGP